MNCQNQNETVTNCGNNNCNTGNAFLIIIVLYILLAIIIGSRNNNMFY